MEILISESLIRPYAGGENHLNIKAAMLFGVFLLIWMFTMSFRKAVHDKKVVPPNKPSFTHENWLSEFHKIENPTDDDRMLSTSGTILFNIFEKLREKLRLLNENIPKQTNENIIKLHCAVSNANLMKLDAKLDMKDAEFEVINMYVPRDLKSLGFDINIPPQDIAESIVDSVHYAISARVSDITKKNSSLSSISISTSNFLILNSYISELYSMFEGYWQGIIWGYYTLELEGEKIIIKQLESNDNIAFLVSLNRKTKIHTMDTTFNNYEVKAKDEALSYKNGKITVKKVKLMSDKNQEAYCALISSSEAIKKRFPKSLIENNIKDKDFSINEVIDIFINIIMFSRDVFDSLTQFRKLEIKNILKLCPEFKIYEISKRLSEITDIRFDRVNKIIEFLTFKSYKDDLWCYPIIKLRNNNLTILLSSTKSPNMLRVIEYWLKENFKDISEKGIVYEKILIDSINKKLSINPIFSDNEPAIGTIFKVGLAYEEIDCIFRFGNTIVMCEAKSIITVDSEISKFNTIKALNKASEQLTRKVDFVEKNIENFFTHVEWDFDENKTYKIVPIIINSNKIFVSGSFGGIPVVDELIISSFFGSGRIPLLTNGVGEHLLWFRIYNDLSEAQSKFEIYLNNIPQIALDSKYTETIKRSSFSAFLNIDYDIEVHNITFKKYSLNDIVSAEYVFPLVKCRDYDSKSREFNILV